MVESQSVTIRKETVVASVKLLCRELIDSNPKGCEEPPYFKLKSIKAHAVDNGRVGWASLDRQKVRVDCVQERFVWTPRKECPETLDIKRNA